MKTRLVGIVAIIISIVFLNSYAQTSDDEADIYADLRSQMQRACPLRWEDLGAAIDTESLNEDIWQGNTEDRADFVALMQEIFAASSVEVTADAETLADDMATVATECASHRVAMLDTLIAKTPRDVLLAMDAVNRGLNKSIEYLDGGWSVGDVRITGRLQAQKGWIFLTGQTVGNGNTSSDLAGDDYNELFELAKNWAPNTGDESWAGGQLIRLPDMRGRTIVAADNMGGDSANVLENPNANTLGGVFGEHTRVITGEQLPSHSHSVNSGGGHTHPMKYAGNHKHNSKQALYGPGNYGWGTFHDKWPTGGIRPNSDGGNSATLTNAVLTNGNHKHTVTSVGGHTHTTSSVGASAEMSQAQPSMVFNVEMKY